MSSGPGPGPSDPAGGARASRDWRLYSVPVEDAAVQAELQPWVEIECVQLSGGRRLAQFDSLDFGKSQIVRERQQGSVQKTGRTPADFCTVSICTQDPAARFSEHSATADDTVFFMPGNVEFDIHIPAGSESAYVGFSQQEFLRGARALDTSFWERPPQTVLPFYTRRRSGFKQAVDLWLQAADRASGEGEPLDPERQRGHLMDAVLQVAIATRQGLSPSYNERRRAFRIGRQARAFVDDRLEADELPTIVEICEGLGVSERTLRYAFRDYVGLSPVAYLRMRRLNRVRAVLKASDPQSATITQIAMRYGFLHLGRFSGDYRRMFGEMPSVTLAS